jgi:cyclic pyranopterin phosphate synthase
MVQKKRKMSHVDDQGAARMVDVGDKKETRRTAIAEGSIRMGPATLDAIRQNAAEKGDVLTVAKVAGISAGKRAAEWIPLCHPLQIDVIDVSLNLDDDLPGVKVRARAGLTGRTGAEMEALVAASAALLTVYDMCKALDRGMEFSVRLVEKSGGRSGTWQRRES